MRLATFVLSLVLLLSLSIVALSEPEAAAKGSSPAPKVTKEILELEKQLRLTIEKHDGAALEKLIADEYFDAYEGAETAMSKSGAIARCKIGALSYLAIAKEQKLTVQPDGVAVEGVSLLNPMRVDDVTPDKWGHVRRLWTKKDSKWRLTSQVRRLTESEEEK